MSGPDLYVPARTGSESEPDGLDREYGSDFAAVARAIDRCFEQGDAVALLLSTCRNQWMTANAAFVDLRLALGGGEPENPFAHSVGLLRSGRFDDAAKRLEEVIRNLSIASDKLDVWDRREDLMRAFEDAIADVQRTNPRDGSQVPPLPAEARERVRAYLRDQQHVRGNVPARADGEFLSLRLAENDEGRGVLDLLRRTHAKAAAVAAALHAVAVAEHNRERASGTLLDEGDGGAVGWSRLIGVLTEGRRGAHAATEILQLGTPPEAPDAAARRAWIEQLLQAAEEMVRTLREKLYDRLRPNVAELPMPRPFILNFRPPHVPLGDHSTEFSVQSAHAALRDAPPSTARVGLLSCGVSDESYSRGEAYRYQRDDAHDDTARVKEIARDALTAAAKEGCQLVAMPECFVPDPARAALEDQAEDLGLMLVAGVEQTFSTATGRVINAATVVVPRSRFAEQRKQRPSVYERRGPEFETDGKLHVFTGTPLGTLGVLICSDYLELDIVWAVAAHQPRLDALLVCSRNPNPEWFQRLAYADVARLHVNVLIVNADPGSEDGSKPASGAGTCVIRPCREQPDLEPVLRVPLGDAIRTEDAAPELLVYEVPVELLSQRMTARTAHTYLGAPHFVTMAAD